MPSRCLLATHSAETKELHTRTSILAMVAHSSVFHLRLPILDNRDLSSRERAEFTCAVTPIVLLQVPQCLRPTSMPLSRLAASYFKHLLGIPRTSFSRAAPHGLNFEAETQLNASIGCCELSCYHIVERSLSERKRGRGWCCAATNRVNHDFDNIARFP